MPAHDDSAAVARCLACGAEAPGRYCPDCGARVTTEVPTFLAFAAEAASELSGAERRIVRTLVTLFRHPGRLTEEYRSGRGALYVAPMRLYMLTSAVFFAAWATDDSGHIPLGPGLSAQSGAGGIAAPALAVVAVPPLFALLRRGAALLSGGRFVELLVYALHLQAVLFLTGVVSRYTPGGAVKLGVFYAYLLWYLFTAERRLWAASTPMAALRTPFVVLLYALAAGFIAAFAGALGL